MDFKINFENILVGKLMLHLCLFMNWLYCLVICAARCNEWETIVHPYIVKWEKQVLVLTPVFENISFLALEFALSFQKFNAAVFASKAKWNRKEVVTVYLIKEFQLGSFRV